MERVETSPGTTVLGLFGRHSVKALIDKLCQSHMCHTHTHTNTWTGGGFALSPRCDVLGVWGEGCVQNAIIKFFNNPLCPDCISICATFLCENLIFHQLVFRQFDCAAKVLLLLLLLLFVLPPAASRKSCTVCGSGAIAYRQSAYCETIHKFSPPIICVLELSEYPLH